MRRSLLTWLVCCASLLYASVSCAQTKVRVAFYNVENFFDCTDDPGKNDEDFTPDGDYHWTYNRFWKKTENIAKVLACMGEDGSFPELIGMAEVEKAAVVKKLLSKANMSDSYRMVHRESPDRRGIDVCLLYNRYIFKPVHTQFIAIKFPQDPQKKTRDLLYVRGTLPDGKDLHVVVSHWPSKSGGEDESRPYRCFVADKLRALADSILTASPKARLVIMGDFNDAPYEESVKKHLKAMHPSERKNVNSLSLFNLMYPLENQEKIKSYKYHETWSMLDQMVVSKSLKNIRAHVFAADFLLTDDSKYLGKKPFRTYNGYHYQGGYSDHLPVYMDIPLDK